MHDHARQHGRHEDTSGPHAAAQRHEGRAGAEAADALTDAEQNTAEHQPPVNRPVGGDLHGCAAP